MGSIQVSQNGKTANKSEEDVVASAINNVDVSTMRLAARSSDPDAPREGKSVMWYSSDQSALMWKDASGLLWRAADLLLPSGDVTGAQDTANIQAAVTAFDNIRLGAGTFYINDAILMPTRSSVVGDGERTVLLHVDSSTAVFKTTDTTHVTLSNMRIVGGLYCIETDGSPRCRIDKVTCVGAASHGIYMHGNTWMNWIVSSTSDSNSGDGVHIVSSAEGLAGNALMVLGGDFVGNDGHGIAISARGVSLHGCHCEINDDSGIYISAATGYNSVGVSIHGAYCETNGIASIEIETAGTGIVSGVGIYGGNFTQAANVDVILCSGVTKSIFDLRLDAGAYLYTSGTGTQVNMGDKCDRANIETSIASYVSCSNPEDNTITNVSSRNLPVMAMTDAQAANNSIYYSSTQSSLAYKNAAGTVTTITTASI